MGTKLALDVDACQGYANCLIESPALFDLDDDTGKAVLLRANPTPEFQAQAEAAVRGCPARAIAIESA